MNIDLDVGFHLTWYVDGYGTGTQSCQVIIELKCVVPIPLFECQVIKSSIATHCTLIVEEMVNVT